MKTLDTLTNAELDVIYERTVGYRAIEDGATREEVISILNEWEEVSGESVLIPQFYVFKQGVTDNTVLILSKLGEDFDKSKKMEFYRSMGYTVNDL